MAAELAQIDFSKKAAEILKTHRRLSHCEEKTQKKPFLRLTFQTGVYFVTHENNFHVPL